MTIRDFVPPVAVKILKRLIKRSKQKYLIGDYEINIPPNFGLPVYQGANKSYDRFLPVLARTFDSDKLIIDVGANIGDTVVALIQVCKNPILCIEPSDLFFTYLSNNIKMLKPNELNRVKTVKGFVGTGLMSGSLNHTEAGTATLNVAGSSSTTTHIPLDKLVSDFTNVVLLKVDTDGYDYDVIKSANQILTDSAPVLFWENYTAEKFQYEGFIEMYDLLDKRAYSHFYIFDNYGNLIIEDTNIEVLKNINSYIFSMEIYNCTRTISYTDILAVTDKHYNKVQEAIIEYKQKWIFN